MPQIDTPGMQLRIYCICGQKMRVSATMFGRPGKCIACRQKIRVPRLDEIPHDATDVYLKDHPEFLRKPNPVPLFSEVDRNLLAPTPVEEVDEPNLGDDEDSPAVALEAQPTLQLLCSLDEKVERQIEKTKRDAHAGGNDRATLIRYRALVRTARSAFDDQLRDRLVETAEQLGNTREAIARASMSLRVGELAHDAYLEKVRPLRSHRDLLERRLQNLRGWLATGDSALAGGYMDVRLEDVPVEAPPLVFAPEAKPTAALLEQHIESLRASMRERAGAERKLAEWQRIERERALPQGEVETGRRESEAIRKRAVASVAFWRARLEQAVQDGEQDNKAIRSFLDAMRGRLQAGEIDANTYKGTEQRLMLAQNDNVHARDLARRALAANSAADLPRPTSTLLQRLAATGNVPNALGWDTWIAWSAAVLMVFNIAVPIARQQVGSNLSAAPVLSFTLFVFAAVIALIGVIPQRALRAWLLNVVWVAVAVGGGGYLHETWLGESGLGLAMRNDPAWFTSPGLIMLLLCTMLTGLAAATSVLAVRELRRAPALAASVILVLLSVILTDVFGQLTARPTLSEPSFTAASLHPGEYEVKINMGNAGWRSLNLGGVQNRAVSPAIFRLERRIGPDSWNDVTLQQLYRDRLGPQLAGRANAFPSVNLGGGENIELVYHLPPGNYRMQVQMLREAALSRVRTLTLAETDEIRAAAEADAMEELAAPAPREVRVPEPTESPRPLENAEMTREASADGGDIASAATPEPAVAALDTMIELQGVINAAGRDPRFIVILTSPGGEPSRTYAALGENLIGPWKAAEFNPNSQTLTVSNGERLLVIERGTPVSLGTWDAVPAEGTAPTTVPEAATQTAPAS